MTQHIKYIVIGIVYFSFLLTNNYAQDKSYWMQQPMPQPLMQAELPELPESIDFAGERVPLENFDVRESLQRDMTVLCYWHSAMMYTLQLSNRYLKIIEPILKEQGVPDDFKYLCIAESNLQNVVSPAKAAGFWQILGATGKQYGLEINNEVDERYNIEKSTIAACKYLKEAYKKFGNWTLAAASYNVGMAHIEGQAARQKTNSYYDMMLNDETARYVYRSVGYKLILRDPAKYGFNVSKSNMFPPLRYKEVTVNTSIESIAEFAQNNGTNYKMIKLFNPWLRDERLTNKTGKSYTIKIPEKGYRQSAY